MAAVGSPGHHSCISSWLGEVELERERECARARVERYKSKQIRKDGEDEVGSRSGSTQ